MKLVALLPFRNEDWVLPAYISSVRPVVDEIVGIDDGSTDRSRELLEAAGAHVFAGPSSTGRAADEDDQWPEQTIRNELLRRGREVGGTHFLMVDADEALTAPAREHLRPAVEALAPGQKLAMQWLATWKRADRYRDDESVWSNSYKDFAFVDDGEVAFAGQWPHRIGRTPGPNDAQHWRRLAPERGSVLHLQFAPWERFQFKQAWYRCAELIRDPRTALEINAMYADGLDDPEARTRAVPEAWLAGVEIPAGLETLGPTWHRDEILRWFDERGPRFFEPVQIWHLPELRERFVEAVGREPRPRTRPRLARLRRPLGRAWEAVTGRRRG